MGLIILSEERVSIIINTIGLFLVNDMQALPLKNGWIVYMVRKDVQCSDTYEKMRNSGNCIYDYAHSFFVKYFQSDALYWYIYDY